METSLYKELSYKVHGFRVLSWLVGAVTILLCALLGVGCYVLIAGMNEAAQEEAALDQITVVEGVNKVGRVVEKLAEVDFTKGTPLRREDEVVDVAPVAHIQQAAPKPIIQEEHDPSVARVDPNSYKTTFSMRYPVVEEINPEQATANDLSEEEQDHGRASSFLQAIAAITNGAARSFLQRLSSQDSQQAMQDAFQSISDFADNTFRKEEHEEPVSHRVRRGVSSGLIGYLPYLSYGAFSKFIYNQASDIAQFRMQSRTLQSRKLGGDAEVDYLDQYWPSNNVQQSQKYQQEEEKISQPLSQASPQKPNKPWEPMVNQVPISFVGEILKTLLTLMKEFLMKDHVMECLWFMFCQDVNHQARYGDVYGILARVNSVGLKVLTEKELREQDTFGEIWRAITAWQPLQCKAMFPKCDGSKALEIVNEVALGSN